jgi:hypothetical protein
MKTCTAENQRRRQEIQTTEECRSARISVRRPGSYLRSSVSICGYGLLILGACAVMPGCIEHRVKADPVEIKPIKVEPIHITVDVNVRVQERLERFFAFEEELEPALVPSPQ